MEAGRSALQLPEGGIGQERTRSWHDQALQEQGRGDLPEPRTHAEGRQGHRVQVQGRFSGEDHQLIWNLDHAARHDDTAMSGWHGRRRDRVSRPEGLLLRQGQPRPDAERRLEVQGVPAGHGFNPVPAAGAAVVSVPEQPGARLSRHVPVDRSVVHREHLPGERGQRDGVARVRDLRGTNPAVRRQGQVAVQVHRPRYVGG